MTPAPRPFAAAILAAALCLAPARADVRLPAVISDHMVLQRECEAPIWGWAEPGEAINVSGDWPGAAPASTKAGPSGDWSVKLRTPPAGGPYTVTITGRNTLKLADVLVGEVWVCSGQSNMEWPVSAAMNAGQEIQSANFPAIRHFAVPKLIEHSPQRECGGQWQVCSPQTAPAFTAVGYFFARELQRQLNVPIGLVNASWGGTVAEAWAGEETFDRFPEFKPALDQIRGDRNSAAQRARDAEQARQAWWSKLDEQSRAPGDPTRPDFDDSSWPSVTLPGAWSGELQGFDGAVWYRRTIQLTPTLIGHTLRLSLGPIDDMDTVWLDGVRIGGVEAPGYWNQPRQYSIPAELATDGPHTLTIRVLDTTGPGGLTGAPEDLVLSPVDPQKFDTPGPARLPLAGEWKWLRGPAMAQLPPWPAETGNNPNRPTVLFNGMISPVIPFALRGAIWYQGESNRGRAAQYRSLFPALIADWRSRWGRGDFPFYFVQLAPFRYGGDTGQTAEIREAQLLTLATPNTGMAVTMDIGNPADIHPANKQEVGRRLAVWALARTYGRTDLEYTGPLFAGATFEGSSIRIRFDHARGLMSRNGAPSHFEIAGADGVFHPARAVIEKDTVLVSSEKVPAPAAARYAWGDADEPNLFNAAGLPASPFRTNPSQR